MRDAAAIDKLSVLRDIYMGDEKTRVVLNSFADRGRSQSLTTVDSLVNRLKNADVSRQTIVRLFKHLEELEFGSFKEGRRGHPSRFSWFSSCIDIGKAAQGVASDIATIQDGLPLEEDESDRQGTLVDHSYFLRSGLTIKLSLPNDLNEREAERLASYVKTLPL